MAHPPINVLFLRCLMFISVTNATIVAEQIQRLPSNTGKWALAERLCNDGVVLSGNFTLKSGVQSPVYFDFRLCQSHPALFSMLVQQIAQKANELNVDIICGVPYGAVPIATCVGLCMGKPLIMCRKEAKQHGTGKLIEGVYKKGDCCVLIEDVITSGSSILETIKLLEQEGILVRNIIVCLDRQAGGVALLESLGYRVHALFTYQELLDYAVAPQSSHPLSFADRIQHAHNAVAKKLFALMERKKTNLACAADVTTKRELLALVDQVGPEICLLKTHIDIIQDFDEDLIVQLRARAEKYQFLIAEDRKFADIGSTAVHQYTGGVYKISQWADIVIAHALPGASMIEALQKNSRDDQAVLMVAEMSCAQNLIDTMYTSKAVCLAEQCAEFVAGFITQRPCAANPGFLHVRPGINAATRAGDQGQCYVTAEEAVAQGADIVIVGRGIYAASDQKRAVQAYRSAAWQAYEKRISC